MLFALLSKKVTEFEEKRKVTKKVKRERTKCLSKERKAI